MKKIGSLHFYEDVDLNFNFDFNDVIEFFKKTSAGVKNEFFDDTGTLKMDLVEKYSIEYVNQKVREKFGEDYSLDVMDDTVNISWDVNVESIKKHNKEKWWDKENKSMSLKLPKLKQV